MMTWGELIGQARFLLQDTVADRYRYSDENLLAACHLACLTARQIRPDLFFGRVLDEGVRSPCFPPPPYDSKRIPEFFALPAPLPEIYHQPVIFFITGYAEIINEEFSGNERAASLLASFKSQLMRATVG